MNCLINKISEKYTSQFPQTKDDIFKLLFQSPKPKDNQFTMMQNIEKQKILTTVKLDPENDNYLIMKIAFDSLPVDCCFSLVKRWLTFACGANWQEVFGY